MLTSYCEIMPDQAYEKTVRGEVYSHIYNRGISDQHIFRDKADFATFVGFLKEYLSPVNIQESRKQTFIVRGRTFNGVPHQPKNYHGHIELSAYSLLPDHFHLLIKQISERSLEKLMRSLSTRYSIYFNKKYKRSGPVFEGPYKSVVLNDAETQHLIRYIHNEVHQDFSSHLEYLGKRKSEWITITDVVESKMHQEDEQQLLERIAIEKLPSKKKNEKPLERIQQVTPLTEENVIYENLLYILVSL